MSAFSAIPARMNAAVDRWLTAPEVNAAGRLGLFRILFGLLYLWDLSRIAFGALAWYPALTWKPVLPFALLNVQPSAFVLDVGEFLLVVCVVLLIVGYQVRWTTLAILVLGVLLEGFSYSLGKMSHGTLFIRFYVPLFMVFSQWGATYSLDAVLRRRKSGQVVSPSESSGRYSWPMRVLLLILSFLYLSGAYWKLADGLWSTNPNDFANVLLNTNVAITAAGRTPSPLLGLLPQVPAITTAMQVMVILFEGSFFLSLFSRPLQNFYLCAALIFHALNSLLLQVGFGQMLAVYAIFVDWQHLYERWMPGFVKRIRLDGVPTVPLIGGALASALLFALIWTQTPVLRWVFSAGGLLTADSIFLLPLPFAVYGVVKYGWALVKGLLPLKRAPTADRPG